MGRGVSHALQICLSDWLTPFRPCCSAMNNDSAVKGLLRSKYCCQSNAGISSQVLYNSISHGCIVERILVQLDFYVVLPLLIFYQGPPFLQYNNLQTYRERILRFMQCQYWDSAILATSTTTIRYVKGYFQFFPAHSFNDEILS